MFIAIPKNLKATISDVSTSSSRVQALVIDSNDKKKLLINTYFPQDPRTTVFDTSELMTTLATISNIIEMNNFNELIWCGDINSHFIRNTKFVDIISEYINEKKLVKSWNKFEVDFTHVHYINENAHTSIIDHFFWNVSIDQSIVDAGVIHLSENLSDHSPIYLVVKENGSVTSTNENVVSRSKPSWKLATEDERNVFRDVLKEKLSELPHLCECHEVHCQNQEHNENLDDFMMELLGAMEQTANETLPVKKMHQKNGKAHSPIARWNEDIEPYKREAHFWHAIWVSCGRPMHNEVHTIMKRTRNVYHYHIRKSKRMLDKVKRDRFLNACLNNENDLFAEIKAMRNSKPSFSNVMDGISDCIPEHFADKYMRLYNSVNDEKEVMDVRNNVHQMISNEDLIEVNRITPNLVKEASKKLTSNKSDPVSDIVSDFLINAPDILYVQLSNIMKSSVTHGYISRILGFCTLLPIIKDKLGSFEDSSNYRSIAISSVILKLFDWVLILLYNDKLHLDHLQFSYQKNCSTSMCTWMVMETIDYFMRNGSDVFVCTMDMSKAFDNVRHSLLFNKLLERGIPPIILRFIIYMYEVQTANVRWNSEVSSHFKLKNGVNKQGGVLSALFYCVYTDDLFNNLRKERNGCWVSGEYMGILGYADDNVLLSPTIDGLQCMLRVCEEYAKEHNLTFSTNINVNKSKTKCMAFTKCDRALPSMSLYGNNLPWVKSI